MIYSLEHRGWNYKEVMIEFYNTYLNSCFIIQKIEFEYRWFGLEQSTIDVPNAECGKSPTK